MVDGSTALRGDGLCHLRSTTLGNVQHDAHRPTGVRDTATAYEAKRVGEFEALARLHAQHGAMEQDPRIERFDRQSPRDMVDARETGIRRVLAFQSWLPGRNRLRTVPPVATSSGTKYDERIVRCTHSRDVGFVPADARVEAGAVQCGRTIQRAYAVVGGESHGDERCAMLIEIRAGERIGLEIHDHVDLTLPVQGDVFRAMAAKRDGIRTLAGTCRTCTAAVASSANSTNATPANSGGAGGSKSSTRSRVAERFAADGVLGVRALEPQPRLRLAVQDRPHRIDGRSDDWGLRETHR